MRYGKNLWHFSKRIASSVYSENWGASDCWLEHHKVIPKNETCYILGNGPSLRNIDNEVLGRFPTFGTNGIFLKFIPTYYVTISKEFFHNYVNEIEDLKCDRKFIASEMSPSFPSFDGSVLNCSWPVYGELGPFQLPVPFGFSKRADRVVYLGGSVLFICLQLAYYLGFKKVILLGVDHHFGFPRCQAAYGGKRIEVEGEDEIHFNPKYNPSGHSMHCDMIATERSFELALKAFQKDGREILNATEGTGLDVIPKVKLQELL